MHQQGSGGICSGFVAPLKWTPCNVCRNTPVRRLPRRPRTDLSRKVFFWGPSLRAATALLQAEHIPPLLGKSSTGGPSSFLSADCPQRKAGVAASSVRAPHELRSGKCVSPAGAARLPAGLTSAKHQLKRSMYERRGRRRGDLGLFFDMEVI